MESELPHYTFGSMPVKDAPPSKATPFVFNATEPKNAKYIGEFSLDTTVRVTYYQPDNKDKVPFVQITFTGDKRTYVRAIKEFKQDQKNKQKKDTASKKTPPPAPVIVPAPAPEIVVTDSDRNLIWGAFGSSRPGNWLSEGSFMARVKNNAPILIEKNIISEKAEYTDIIAMCLIVDEIYTEGTV